MEDRSSPKLCAAGCPSPTIIGLSFFVGDGSGTGARWRLVLGWLEDLVRRGALGDEIVASARETFCSLGRWVELIGASR